MVKLSDINYIYIFIELSICINIHQKKQNNLVIITKNYYKFISFGL